MTRRVDMRIMKVPIKRADQGGGPDRLERQYRASISYNDRANASTLFG